MTIIQNTPKFISCITVNKASIAKLKSFSANTSDALNNMGTTLTNPLYKKFETNENVAIRWVNEGYSTAPKYRMKIPHIGFVATPEGIDPLLCYLDNCKKNFNGGEYWKISFQDLAIKRQGGFNFPTITWSLGSFLEVKEKARLFNLLIDEYDNFF